jgi:hypothetical protein
MPRQCAALRPLFRVELDDAARGRNRRDRRDAELGRLLTTRSMRSARAMPCASVTASGDSARAAVSR